MMFADALHTGMDRRQETREKKRMERLITGDEEERERDSVLQLLPSSWSPSLSLLSLALLLLLLFLMNNFFFFCLMLGDGEIFIYLFIL